MCKCGGEYRIIRSLDGEYAICDRCKEIELHEPLYRKIEKY